MDTHVKNLYSLLKSIADGRARYNSDAFSVAMEHVERHAILIGLNQEEFHALVLALSKIDMKRSNFPSTALQKMIRGLIPKTRLKKESLEILVVWFMTHWLHMPKNASKTTFMWFIGALKFELIQADDINWCYDSFCRGFDIHSFKMPHAKFLELITTPDLVTRSRTQYLLNEFNKLKQQSQPLLHILSLFKALRPDMMPMQIPVITSDFNSSAEKRLLDDLEVASVRAENAAHNDDSYNFARIRWAMQKKKTKKHDEVLPAVSYNIDAAQHTKGKELLQCETMKDVAANILSARTPAQILSLITNPEAVFYLKYQNDDVKSRFNYCLRMMFSTLEIFYCVNNLEEDIASLLTCVITKQEIDQKGSSVITSYYRDFLMYNQNTKYLPLVLKLTTWPQFSGPEDLKSNTLIPLEQAFSTSKFQHKCLVIEALWSMAFNMLMEFADKQADDFEWNPSKSLEMVTKSIEKMYNHCIAAKGILSLEELKISGINHYLKLSNIERTLHRSFQFYTVAPSSLIIGCFISGSPHLLELSANLVLGYRERSKTLTSAVKRSKTAELASLESIYHTLLDLFVDDAESQTLSLIKASSRERQIPVISRRFMSKHKLLRHVGFLITRLNLELNDMNEWNLQDALEFCSNNLPNFTHLLAILHNEKSQKSS
ncbi:uncharacterized protein LOC135942397 isoform X2 [Cloeon dipterum]|uniref:uncharacterized protein LOC135942397 isoform X2 n=1 Tax=Cloeon dipterum TaxID=197152 RepID=UPI00321F6364